MQEFIWAFVIEPFVIVAPCIIAFPITAFVAFVVPERLILSASRQSSDPVLSFALATIEAQDSPSLTANVNLPAS